MAGLLGIQDNLTDAANAFYPHYNIDHWDGETNSFPLESSVGDIFINGYDQLSEFCLFELNPESIDGKSLRDRQRLLREAGML